MQTVQHRTVANPEEKPGGAAPTPLFLDKIEAHRTEKILL